VYEIECNFASGYGITLCESPALDISNGSLSSLIGERRTLMVTTPTVDRLYGQRLRRHIAARSLDLDIRVEVLPLSEQDKTMENTLAICALAKGHGLGRRDLIVAFGGGVCADMVTLAASLVRRGIGYACLPTTLVSQIDASIGLKGGVNFGGSKNYLGCFKPPSGVLVDPGFLATLPARHLRCGMAEIVKIAVVRDAKLFSTIERFGPSLIASGFREHVDKGHFILGRSIELMLEELERNCFEDQGFERLVDFGHTFSPLLEVKSDYRIAHGEAVAIDMALSSAIAVEIGLLDRQSFDRIIGLLLKLGLPIHAKLVTPTHMQQAMLDATLHRDGCVNLVVPTSTGSADFIVSHETITETVMDSAIEALVGFLECEAIAQSFSMHMRDASVR
jgi:3-dehydroquinate synthetase